ncbi:hypothetical protein, partial [Natronomonas sp.]|uniref:hypothetical protein n=1 Tax=Natronomonas sp. TaxID=2184060 RepID=UPI0039755C52
MFSIVGGVVAYSLGDELYTGGATLPIETVRIAITISTLALLIEFTREASKRLEHIHVDHLLMTVPERDLLLGVVLFVYSSAIAKFVLPTLGVAIGFGLSTRSMASAFSIVIAAAGLLALAVVISINLSFAIDYVTSRSIFFQRYKRRIFLVATIFVVFVWPIASELMDLELSISILANLPLAWFVDFVLLSIPGGQAEFFRGVGAIAMLVGGIPVLTITATALAKRVWNTVPVNSATLHQSRSLVGSGAAEHLFVGHISRPVLTVARKRWLQERRVPRGLLIAGYMLLILPIVYLPILASGKILPSSPLLFALVVAVGIGIAFGLELLSSEYPTLPMTLTSVSGRQFVRGTILAGTTVSVPILLGVTVPLGVGSSISNIETVLLTIVGFLLCICSVTLAATIGMNTPYQKFWP